MSWAGDESLPRIPVSRVCDATAGGVGCADPTRWTVELTLRASRGSGDTCVVQLGMGFCSACVKRMTLDKVLANGVWETLARDVSLDGKPPVRRLTSLKFVEAWDG